MKALVVDDERLARKELIELLKEFDDIEVEAEAQNVDEALKITENFTPDVVFLDIQMPEKDGFQFLEALDSCPFEVVFVTAYDEFALKAFDVNAFDYLLKPIDKQRLERVVERLRKLVHSKKSDLNEHHAERDTALSTEDRIFIRDGEKCWFVQLADIEVFESYGNYVRVFFKEHKPLILKSLNLIEERLDEKKFFRANRKHIVNMDYIAKVESWFNGGFMLYLKNGQEIEVSRRQAIKFKQLMSL
jgi:two-component system, LytTR family, response regulator